MTSTVLQAATLEGINVNLRARVRLLVTSCIACTLLVSCAASGPTYSSVKQPAPDDQHALVYVYRLNSLVAAAYQASFFVDSQPVADLSRDGYTAFRVLAGPHKFVQSWPAWSLISKETELDVTWLAGRRYYYRLDTDMQFAGPTRTFSWRLAPVGEATANSQMAERKFQAPLRANVSGN
jgi:hypothetical protein